MKKAILKLVKIIIFRFSEKTKAEVKYSELNFRVAKVLLSIEELGKII